MKKSRLFSLLTAAVLTATGFWPNAALNASAETEFSGAKIPDFSAIAYSENSFGAMIADTINQENSRIMMSSVVHSVEMNGTEATVSYDSTQAGRAVVCVYEDVAADSAPRLLGTGIREFTAELNTVTVPVQIDALPEYYLVRVFLIGENEVPLSAEYSDPMHTREMQMLLRSDISYFMEDYEVLNMDGSTETNFAVFNKDVTVLHYSKTENRVLSQDNENFVFEIQNYTGPTRTGTVVAVECGNGTAAIFRIGSVKTDGNVTTIQGDRSMKTNDAFAYIKMETNTEDNEYSYTPPELPEEYANLEISGSVVSGQKPSQGRPGIADGENAGSEEVTRYSGEKMFRIQLGKGASYDNDNNEHNLSDAGVGVEIDGIVELDFQYDIAIYETFLFDHIEMNCSNIFNYGFEVSATAEIKVPLGAAIIFNPCGEINFTLGPYLVATITGIVRLTGTIESSFGTESGVEAKPFIADFNISAEGFIGFGIGGELGVFGKGGELSLEVGLKVALAPNEPHGGCQTCYAVTLSLEVRFTASIDLGLFDLGIAPTRDFTIGRAYCSDTLGFGFGDCPHLGNPPEDDPDDPGQDDPGQTDPPIDDGLTEEQRNCLQIIENPSKIRSGGMFVEVKKEHIGDLVSIQIPAFYQNQPVTRIGSGIGNSATSSSIYHNYSCFFDSLDFYSGGFSNCQTVRDINIPGTVREIEEYAFIDTGSLQQLRLPSSVERIGKGAFCRSGLTQISLPASLKELDEYAFLKCSQLRSVSFPSSLESIGEAAFAECSSLKKVTLPRNLKKLGNCAFADCKSLRNVRIPKSVKSFSMNTFVNCDALEWILIENPEAEIGKQDDLFGIFNHEKLKIYGYTDSTAQTFAEENDFTFVPLDPRPASTESSESSGTAVSEQPAADAPKSITFTKLLPNTVYNFYDLLGDDFTAENLLYLSQGVSDESGSLTVLYRPKSDDTDAKKYVKCASTEKPVSKIKGDANGDFVVDVSDAVLCARFCAEDATAIISYQGIRNADVNGDGNTDPDDTIMILKFIARRITSFD